jgi:hypothetical protein
LEGKNQRKSDVKSQQFKRKRVKKKKRLKPKENICHPRKNCALRTLNSDARFFIADRDKAYFSEWEVKSKLNITPSKNDGTTVHSSVPGNGRISRRTTCGK